MSQQPPIPQFPQQPGQSPQRPNAFGRPSGPVTALPPEPGEVKPNRPWYKKKRFIIPAAIVVLLIVAPKGGDADADGKEKPAAVVAQEEEKTAEEIAAEEKADAEATAKAEEEAAKKAEEEAAKKAEEERIAAEEKAAADAAAAAEAARIGSVSQQNAYESAKSYLDFAGFSRVGLLDQLTSAYGEGFPPADAEFAIARLEAEGAVDWNAEAVESAQSYLSFSSFSRSGLIDQLTSQYGEGFTREQAEFAATQVGL